MPIPLICNIVKEARLSGDEKRIQYAHSIITSYGELMSLSVDGKPQLNKNTKKEYHTQLLIYPTVHAKAERVHATMQHTEFAQYITVLTKSYIELRGVVMFRQSGIIRVREEMGEITTYVL